MKSFQLLQFFVLVPGVGENAFHETDFASQSEIIKKEVLRIMEYTELYKNEIEKNLTYKK